jgi:acetyl-CoA acetyltransferase family protein
MQAGLTDAYVGLPMGITAENIAQQWSITRQASDAFALQSQSNYQKALEADLWKDEIAPMDIQVKKDTVTLSKDEHPRPQTTLDELAKLKPVFDPKGIVTAGSSSGIVDGAAAVLVMSKAEAKRRGLPYLATIEAHGISGCDPKIMGMGPVQACTKALQSSGHSIMDMDHVEVNEAFAPQVLAVAHELGIAPGRLNPNGGAIAVGHPLAASGTRITLHAALSLHRNKQKYALVSACIGGGQGIALILKNDTAS